VRQVKCEELKITIKEFHPEMKSPSAEEFGQALDNFTFASSLIYSTINQRDKLKKLNFPGFSFTKDTLKSLIGFKELQELVIQEMNWKTQGIEFLSFLNH